MMVIRRFWRAVGTQYEVIISHTYGMLNLVYTIRLPGFDPYGIF